MRSMTGYGRAETRGGGRTVTVELRSVNHRFADIQLRLPHSLAFMEAGLKKRILETVKRGHVEAHITLTHENDSTKQVVLDTALLERYEAVFCQMRQILRDDRPVPLSFYAQLPDIITLTEQPEQDDALCESVFQALEEALRTLNIMRDTEGSTLKNELLCHLEELAGIHAQILLRAPQVPEQYRKRLENRLQEWHVEEADGQRLAQEVALMADKCAIDEELDRLSSHIAQMKTFVNEEGETGKKMDFLVQEMNREVNTIGSKANDLFITQQVVKAKNEIEKMREQIQNIE